MKQRRLEVLPVLVADAFGDDGFGYELLFGIRPSEAIGVHFTSDSVDDADDGVFATFPMGFGEIACGPVRGMVGMGMVEADDLESLLAGVSLDADEVGGSDRVTLRAVELDVLAADALLDDAHVTLDVAKKHTATLVGICLFGMCAEFFEIDSAYLQHANGISLLCSNSELPHMKRECSAKGGRPVLWATARLGTGDGNASCWTFAILC